MIKKYSKKILTRSLVFFACVTLIGYLIGEFIAKDYYTLNSIMCLYIKITCVLLPYFLWNYWGKLIVGEKLDILFYMLLPYIIFPVAITVVPTINKCEVIHDKIENNISVEVIGMSVEDSLIYYREKNSTAIRSLSMRKYDLLLYTHNKDTCKNLLLVEIYSRYSVFGMDYYSTKTLKTIDCVYNNINVTQLSFDSNR